MSKKVKESLHELIKALTKSEKRYFKLMSSRHTIGLENNYVILFDFIEKQNEYDENQIFKFFKGEAFLNKFSITKKRLYDQILNALDAFHKSSSIDAQLYQLIHSADILNEKSLYDQAKTVLRSAEKLAVKNERYTILLIIKKKQKILIENDSYESVSKEDLNSVYFQDNKIHSKSLLYDKLWYYKSRLFQLLASKGNNSFKEELELFKIEFDQFVLQLDNTDFYFESEYLKNHIYSAYYFAIKDYSSCLKNLKSNVTAFELEESKILELPNKYFSILTNAIYVTERLILLEESNYFFNKLKLFQEKLKDKGSEDLKIKLFSSVSSIELNKFIDRGDFIAALKILPKIESNLFLYDDKLTSSRKMYFSFKIAVVYIGVKDFSKALKWINSILNNQQFDQNEIIYSHTQLLNLIVHFEMGHKELLSYLAKNAQRFFRSKKRFGEFESEFFILFNKLIKESDENKKVNLWVEYYCQLSNSTDNLFLDYFDLVAWSYAKGHNIDFYEVIKERKLIDEKKAITN